MDDAPIKHNFSELSEFFSAVAKEKSENRKKLENTIEVVEDDKVPEDTPINVSEDASEPQIVRSDLANLFKNLEFVVPTNLLFYTGVQIFQKYTEKNILKSCLISTVL